MSGILSNDDVQEKKLETDGLRRQQYDEDLRAQMSTRTGRRFMARVVWDAGALLRLSYVPGDPHGTAFNEGVRGTGIHWANQCRRVTPREYIQMQQEQFEDALLDDERRKIAEARAKST